MHDLEISPIELDYGVAKFDLSLVMAERREGLLVHFEYNTDLYERSTIERMVAHFDYAAGRLSWPIRCSPSRRCPCLAPPNGNRFCTTGTLPTPQLSRMINTIHALLEDRVAAQPDLPAILYFRDITVSYAATQ